MVYLQRVQIAQSLAPGKVFLALSLISYDQEVSSAMAFVFGNTFICEDSETAKKVTFDRRVNARSVTWDGDVYEPGGTLSGGSTPSSSGILVRSQQFILKQREWRKADEELRRLQNPPGSDGQKREQWLRYRQEIGMKRHELELLTAQTSGSDAAIVCAALFLRPTIWLMFSRSAKKLQSTSRELRSSRKLSKPRRRSSPKLRRKSQSSRKTCMNSRAIKAAR